MAKKPVKTAIKKKSTKSNPNIYDYGIKILRLKDGEDVFAKVTWKSVKDMPEHFILENPLKLIYYPSPDNPNKIMVGFVPWVFTSITDEKSFLIYTNDVLTMIVPNEHIIKYSEYFLAQSEKINADLKTNNILSNLENLDDTHDEEIEDMVNNKLEEIQDKIRNGGKGKRTLH